MKQPEADTHGDKFLPVSREVPGTKAWKPDQVQGASIKLTSPMRTSIKMGSQVTSIRAEQRVFNTEVMLFELAKEMYERDFGVLDVLNLTKIVTHTRDHMTMELIVQPADETSTFEVGDDV